MRRAGKMGLAALLMIAAMGASPVQAQPAPAAPEAAVSQDEVLFREGNAFAAREQWVEAEAKFRAAWKLNPTHDITGNLGQTEFRLHKYRDAAEHLEFAVRTWGVTGDRTPKERAKKRLDEVRKLVTSLRVKVSVEGAAVLIDGKTVGTSPIEHDLFVDPGTRTIEARLSGHDTAKKIVEAKKGDTLRVELAPTLTRAAAVENEPKHEILLPPIQPPEARSWVPTIALGAASVVGLGVAVGLTVAANNASSDGEAQRAKLRAGGGGCLGEPSDYAATCSALDDDASRLETFTRGATIAYVASGVLAISTVAYVLWPHLRSPASGGVRALPAVGAGHAGIDVTGVW
jgi:hypothetical protein